MKHHDEEGDGGECRYHATRLDDLHALSRVGPCRLHRHSYGASEGHGLSGPCSSGGIGAVAGRRGLIPHSAPNRVSHADRRG